MISLIKLAQSFYSATGKAVLGLKTQQLQEQCTFSTGSTGIKVTIVGGAGRIGQSLGLMLKQSPMIDELCIYDEKEVDGLVSELNHIDTNCKVTGFSGKKNIAQALSNSKLVAVLVADPECDKLDFAKQWAPNAKIVKEIVTQISTHCPRAFLAMGTNPVNSTVPLACEILKKTGMYNPNTIFGITTLDTVRANTFAARVLGLEPENVLVPVIGGHTEETIVPVLSNTKPAAQYTNEELESITTNVKKAHEHMLKLKPAESVPLASAFASARFIISVIKAMKGYQDIVECAYVPSKIHPDLKYLATPLVLGPHGILKNLGIPMLSEYESCMLDNAINPLVDDIKRGEVYAGFTDAEGVCDPCNIEVPRCAPSWCEYQKDPVKQ